MPTLGVTVAVIRDGQVLVTKRADFPMWCLPGGGVDAGESVAQAAVREVREETGLRVVLTRLVGIYSRPRWHRGGDHNVCFAASPVGGTPRAQEAEVREVSFHAPDALPEPFLWWHHQEIEHALGGVGGAVWTQDAVWPLESDLSFGQILALRDREPAPARRVLAEFCRRPRPEELRLELGGADEAT